MKMPVMSSVRNIQIVLFGVGGVGSAFVKQLIAARPLHLQHHNLEFSFLAVCDSTAYVQPYNDDELLGLLKHKQNKHKFSSLPNAKPFKTESEILSNIFTNEISHSTILVDCSAHSTDKACLLASQKDCGIVFANKKPLSSDQNVFDSLANGRTKYESTCGAGTPFVSTLQRLINSGDKILKIQGTFSGTLGYLMNSLESGQKYSNAVHDAYEKKYTEPDPRDDLSGVDVARKALILARTIGIKDDLSKFKIEALFPDSWKNKSVDEFMKELNQLDEEYAKRNSEAQSRNCVLRYVATIDVQSQTIEVGLKAVPKSSPLGQLQGTQNMAEYYTEIYQTPLVVCGAGAGVEVTAAGVIADCVELAQILNVGQQTH